MAGIRNSRNPVALESFIVYLQSDEASAFFADFGFTPLPAPLDP